ncbi:MAG: hypothetical protein VX460_05245 [Planctomycetota bacterium]|nr:hypothetical protein [Planctomycetota bacterium]
MEAARRLRAPRDARPIQGAPRPDPAATRARALGSIWVTTGAAAVLLAALAAGASRWTGGDPRAALLPGVPAGLLAVLFAAGIRPGPRRAAMALATATSGMLAIATASSLGSLGDPAPAVRFQLACLVIAAVHLAVATPAWRRVDRDGAAADELLRMYEEL